MTVLYEGYRVLTASLSPVDLQPTDWMEVARYHFGRHGSRSESSRAEGVSWSNVSASPFARARSSIESRFATLSASCCASDSPRLLATVYHAYARTESGAWPFS